MEWAERAGGQQCESARGGLAAAVLRRRARARHKVGEAQGGLEEEPAGAGVMGLCESHHYDGEMVWLGLGAWMAEDG